MGQLVPAYAPFFRTVVNHVRVEAPLETDPVQARARLLAALRSGRLFVTLEDADEVQSFDVWAGSPGGTTARMGEQMPWADSTVLWVSLPPAVTRAAVRVLRDGVEAAWLEGRGGEVVGWSADGPGRYRVEVFRPGRKVGGFRFGFRPWLVSNPVELVQQGVVEVAGPAPRESEGGAARDPSPGEG
jgi:hypothetical protein